jgi:TIR domain
MTPAPPPGGPATPDSEISRLPAPLRDDSGGPDAEHAPISPAAGGQALPPPLFFISYSPSKSGGQVGAAHEAGRFADFFKDLSYNVGDLVPRPAGADPGYLDRSIPPGAVWTEDLCQALGTCQVFVALLSPHFLISEWCGREWFAFTQRTVTAKAGGGRGRSTAIIPVVWAAHRDDDVPAAISKVQRFSPPGVPGLDIEALYRSEGVVGLINMGLEIPYRTVIWRIAQVIADFYYNYQVEPRILREGELRNAFREEAT